MALGTLKTLTQMAKSVANPNGKEVLTVPVGDVVPKDQVRKKFTNIAELAETMKTEGQQTPIIVSPKNSAGKYVIQKGERRWRAISMAELPTIDILINTKEQAPLDEVAGELIENIQRENLTAMEIADALGKFVDAGWQQKDLATRIGKSRAFVSTHLSLRKLPEGVRELFDADIVLDADTLSLLRKVYELDPARCNVVCNMAKKQGITRKHARELLDAVAAKIQAQKEAEKTAKEQAKSVGKGSTKTPTSNVEVEKAEQAERRAQTNQSAGVEEKSESTKASSSKGKPDQANPFLEPDERNPKRTTGSKAVKPATSSDADSFDPVDPSSLVIAVRVLDANPWEGELALNRLAGTAEQAWVRDVGTENLICVDVKNLQIIGVRA